MDGQQINQEERQPQPDSTFSSSRRILVAIAAALLVAVAAAGAYFFLQHGEKAVSRQYATYSYNNFETYTVKGASNGFSISFLRPTELKVQTSTANQVELLHYWKNNNAVGQTYIAALSQKSPLPTDEKTLTDIKNAINNPKSPSYGYYTSMEKSFVKERMPSGWQTNLSSAKAFTNDTIKNNAWSFDVNSSNKNSAFEGKSLMIIGKTNFYYFVVVSNAHNWQIDTQAWQQILNSVRVDQ